MLNTLSNKSYSKRVKGDTRTSRTLRGRYAKREIVQIKVFTDAAAAEKAEKILSKVMEKLSLVECETNIEPYHKGGFVCSFFISSSIDSWPDVVLNTINTAQIIGRSWLLTGDINNEIEMWSNESPIIGVKSINVFVSANT